MQQVNSEYKLELIIKCEFPGDKPTYFSWFKAGLAVACPNGAIMVKRYIFLNKFRRISLYVFQHFKKSGKWCCDWQVTPKITVVRLLNSPRDFLLGVTERGDIVVYNNQTQEFSYIKQYEILFRGLCLIYPVGEIIVTLAWCKTLTAWEVSTGTPVRCLIPRHLNSSLFRFLFRSIPSIVLTIPYLSYRILNTRTSQSDAMGGKSGYILCMMVRRSNCSRHFT